MGGFRAATAALVPDGQSLNIVPTSVDNWPIRLCDDLGLNPPIDVHCGGGFHATRLDYAPTWVRPYGNAALTTIYTLCGGTTDIAGNRTGAQVYASMVTLADQARTWGYDVVIGMTITPWTAGFSGPQLTQWADANTRILADADTAFDYTVDLANTAGIDDSTDAAYYSDGLHFTALGAQTAADAIAPSVIAALA